MSKGNRNNKGGGAGCQKDFATLAFAANLNHDACHCLFLTPHHCLIES